MSYIPVDQQQQYDPYGEQYVQQVIPPQQMMQQVPAQYQPVQQVMQQRPQQVSPQRQPMMQSQVGMPATPQYQPPVQRMQQTVPVVKSRPPGMQPVQQVPMQAVQQVPMQQVPFQQPVYMAPPQQVEMQEPVYYEEQPQYVEVPQMQQYIPEQQPVQYVEVYDQEPQYVEHQPVMVKSQPPVQTQYVEPAYQPVVKSAPPTQFVEPIPQQQPMKYVKSRAPIQQDQYVEYQPAGEPVDGYFDDIEPTETDIGDGADLDEGTVTALQREPAPVITGERVAQKDTFQPKVVKSSFQPRKSAKNVSPRITAMPTSTKNVDRANTMYVKKTTQPPNQYANQYEQLVELQEQDFSHDDWKNIQKKIDRQYEKKLKEVGDDALKKLKMFQAEHKALLEKTQYLIEHSRIEDEADEDFMYEQQRPVAQTERKVNNDRNRFFTPQVQEQIIQDDFEYRQPQQVKTSAKGPQVIRKSQPQQPARTQPTYEEQIAQSAPQKRYMEQPVQQVKQFVQQPVYQQPVQMVQAQPQQQYVPAQQPVRYVVPDQQQPPYYQGPPPQQQYVPQQQPVQQQMQQPRQVKRSPMRQREPMYQSQSFADTRPVVKSQKQPMANQYIPDTYSEPPARFQQKKEDQYSFGQRTEPFARSTVQQKKSQYQRTKSAPRDARDQQYSQPKTRPTRDRSANYKTATEPRYNTAAKNSGYPQVKSKAPGSTLPPMQQEEEPICVLKVELDGGQNVQLLRVFEGQIPEEIVEEFGHKFNVSENAKHKLLSRIYEQLQQ